MRASMAPPNGSKRNAESSNSNNTSSGRSGSNSRGAGKPLLRAGSASAGDRSSFGTASTGRATLQPKQRGSTGGSGARSTSNGSGLPMGRPSSKSSAATPTPVSAFQTAISSLKQESLGKSEQELELQLQDRLRSGKFADAAYLIEACPLLNAKYKTSDVVRLVLETRQFDLTARLIRELGLQANQLLVTLFIKELIRSAQFHAAVRYAQEMVQNFGKQDFGPREQVRPSWTPQALIQAMIRAQQFKTALKFVRQFELLETFPPRPLIASMLEAHQWEDAVSSVMEYKLFGEFPMENLIRQLLQYRQWASVIKCIAKLSTKELKDQSNEALVRESARVGDFIDSLRYLREFKLDNQETHPALLRWIVDCMISQQEFYKAIKYAYKFGLTAQAESDPAYAQYNTNALILKAMECGHYHVARTYIKRLGLKDKFQKELAEIEQQQQARLREFRDFVRFRDAQYNHVSIQTQLLELVNQPPDQYVDSEPTLVDLVIAEVQEIVPRKQRTKQPEADERSTNIQYEEDDGDDEVILLNQSVDMRAAREDRTAVKPQEEPRSNHRESRFNFARAHSEENAPSSVPERTALLPPPGLQQLTQPPSAPQAPPQPTNGVQFANDMAGGGFSFSQFAKSVQISSQPSGNQPTLPPPPPPSMLSRMPPPPGGMQPGHQNPMVPQSRMYAEGMPPSSAGMASQQQQMRQQLGPQPPAPFMQQQHQQAMSLFHNQPPPMPAAHQRFSNSPSPAPPGMFFQGNMPSMASNGPSHHAPGSFMQPPLPSPPLPQSSQHFNSNNTDIAALAMQFHSHGAGGNNGMSFGTPARGPPPPPSGPGAFQHLFSMAPPPQAFVPVPPRPSFKPSIGYTTSVVTSRPKQ